MAKAARDARAYLKELVRNGNSGIDRTKFQPPAGRRNNWFIHMWRHVICTYGIDIVETENKIDYLDELTAADLGIAKPPEVVKYVHCWKRTRRFLSEGESKNQKLRCPNVFLSRVHEDQRLEKNRTELLKTLLEEQSDSVEETPMADMSDMSEVSTSNGRYNMRKRTRQAATPVQKKKRRTLPATETTDKEETITALIHYASPEQVRHSLKPTFFFLNATPVIVQRVLRPFSYQDKFYFIDHICRDRDVLNNVKSMDEFKELYSSYVKKLHPDKTNGSEERFVILQKIGDPENGFVGRWNEIPDVDFGKRWKDYLYCMDNVYRISEPDVFRKMMDLRH